MHLQNEDKKLLHILLTICCLFIWLNSVCMASCCFLCDLVSGYFKASFNVFGSSSVDFEFSATMVIVARSIRKFKFCLVFFLFGLFHNFVCICITQNFQKVIPLTTLEFNVVFMVTSLSSSICCLKKLYYASSLPELPIAL